MNTLWRVLLSLLLLIIVLLTGLTRCVLSDLPGAGSLPLQPAPDTTKIYDRHGHLLWEFLDPRSGARTYVPLEEIPLYLRQATIAIEDAGFYDNPGIEPRALLRALVQNLAAKRVVSGGSTITQQLARLMLMSPRERQRRTLPRKLREMALALRLARTYSKDKILELYLNEVYYGNLAYGVAAAARLYFGVRPQDLDLAQCALLAGLPQSPAAYDPLVHYDAAKARQRTVLDAMVRRGYITPQEADLAYAEPLRFVGPEAWDMPAPHFMNYVRNLLEEELGAETLLRGGWAITTTLDLDLQREVENIVRRHLADLRQHDAHNAAVVVLEVNTGEILAMVGSVDYWDARIAGAVNVCTALRQPGSALKPILYAAAFTQGYTPATVVHDAPTIFLDEDSLAYVPVNYDRRYHGPITLREALANSYNLPAVLLQQRVGTETMLDLAHEMGLTSLTEPRRYGLTLTLGGGEVRLLELTAAYGAFASGGIYHPPTAILHATRIPNHESRPSQPSNHPTIQLSNLPTSHPLTRTVLSSQVAYLITHILSDNYARAPSFGLDSPLLLSRPAAAKTGTTTNWRDNWTVGYTSQRVVGVWVGNSDGAPMQHVSGISGAGPIWHDVMEAAHRGLPVRPFQEPPGLVWRRICPLSGLLAGPHCPEPRQELFIAGTEPTQICDQHTGNWELGTGNWKLEAGNWKGVTSLHHSPPHQPTSYQSTNYQSTNYIYLLSPAAGGVYFIDLERPLETQAIEVQVAVAEGWDVARVELWVDGQRWQVLDSPPYRALWPLRAGKHIFWAVGIGADEKPRKSPLVEISVQQKAPTRLVGTGDVQPIVFVNRKQGHLFAEKRRFQVVVTAPPMK